MNLKARLISPTAVAICVTATPLSAQDSTADTLTPLDSIMPAAAAEAGGIDTLPVHLRIGDVFHGTFDWLPVADSLWPELAEDSVAQEFGAEILFDYSRIQDFPDMITFKSEQYRRIYIANEQGVDNGEVSLTVSEGAYGRLEIRGRTVRSDGSVVELDPTQIRLTDTKVTDNLTQKNISFSLPAVAPQTIVEFYIKLIDSSGDFHVWSYQRDLPVREARRFWYPTRKVPETYVFWYRLVEALGLRFNFSSTTEPELIKDQRAAAYLWSGVIGETETIKAPAKDPHALVFVARNVPAFRTEPFSFPEAEQRARVSMYRTSYSHIDDYWGDVADRLNRYRANFGKKRRRMEKAADKIMKKYDETTWVDSLYSWLQRKMLNFTQLDWVSEAERARKFRVNKRDFDGLEFDSYDEALRVHVATANQINMIFASALSYMGIDAEIVYVVDRQERVLKQTLPYWQFDRAIALVTDPQTGEVRPYDPGNSCLAPGESCWQHQGVTALSIKSGRAEFVATPIDPANVNAMTKLLEILRWDADSWEATVTHRLT
ncbi:MAG TPA: DUF3857 domain-containing protein, partial [candidate division Zixibacteria bacterium]|nr:DUF3857 domain-containing protein [candidate division Zixibacteria bacterium]